MLSDPAYPNIHQKLINKCRKGDRKAQFELEISEDKPEQTAEHLLRFMEETERIA